MSNKKSDYWRNKVSLWLHDPVCKVFDIPHHEEIASKIADLLYQTVPDKDNYQAADCIASSLTRSLLPSAKDGGCIDFSDNTQIVHPLVKKVLPVDLPEVDVKKLCAEIENLLTEDLGLNKTYEEMQGLSEKEKPLNACFNYKDSPEDWAKSLFNYLFFAFQKRLRNENVANLGAIWDILPADTRMPDHPLWHHLGLVSAIGSSLSEDSNSQIDMAVFSITPVQDFIAKARKLRDDWTGSVLLSYLAFTGIACVMDELGPDHIVYPSLHNQPLVNDWLVKNCKISEKFLSETGDLKTLLDKTKGIAAFPNKFIFLCPHDKVKELNEEITKTVKSKWIEISSGVKEYIQKQTGAVENFSELWNIQIEDFWNFSWASAKLAELSDKEKIEKLVSGDVVEKEFEVLDSFSKQYSMKNVRLYTSTHSLVQSVLAAGKTKPAFIRRPQNGIKCPLCGEREVLNDFRFAGTTSAKEYSKNVDDFWNRISETDKDNKNIRKNEKLCAVCAVKRFLPIVSKKYSKDSILQEVFKAYENFPSTTEMAADSYIKNLSEKIAITQKECIDIRNYLHNEDNYDEDTTDTEKTIKDAEKKFGIKFTNKDKYYAVLLMDGDKMGDLINGETLEAKWKDVIHEDLAAKIENGTVKAPVLKKYFDEKRTLNPALHAMISDSLNNFARFGVQPAVENAGGKLIYAGGDDVCAVLPLRTAAECAKKIAESYTMSFAEYTENGAVEIDKLNSSMKKVGYHLGHGAKGISLSGAIVIAHHKEPLREVIQDAHKVLDSIAKEKTGRNAIAIRLKKRSGGDRDFSCKWNDENIFDSGKTVLKSFMNICNAAKSEEISTSLLYKLQNMEDFFEPILDCTDDNKNKIVRILKYELYHSGIKIKENKLNDYSKDLAGICFKKEKNEKLVYNFESAVIANFLQGVSFEGADK